MRGCSCIRRTRVTLTFQRTLHNCAFLLSLELQKFSLIFNGKGKYNARWLCRISTDRIWHAETGQKKKETVCLLRSRHNWVSPCQKTCLSRVSQLDLTTQWWILHGWEELKGMEDWRATRYPEEVCPEDMLNHMPFDIVGLNQWPSIFVRETRQFDTGKWVDVCTSRIDILYRI